MHHHEIHKCKHGVIVLQCRCFTPGKRVVIVACPPECDRKATTPGNSSTG